MSAFVVITRYPQTALTQRLFERLHKEHGLGEIYILEPEKINPFSVYEKHCIIAPDFWRWETNRINTLIKACCKAKSTTLVFDNDVSGGSSKFSFLTVEIRESDIVWTRRVDGKNVNAKPRYIIYGKSNGCPEGHIELE